MNSPLPSLLLILSTSFLCATCTLRPAANASEPLPDACETGISPSHPQAAKVTDVTKNKVTPFLMFNDQLEAAMALYAATFPDSRIQNVSRAGKDGPMTAAEFVIGGQSFMGFNGGSYFSFSEGFSLFVDCKDQAEVDLYWDRLVKAGSKPTQCGWIKDPFGLSWQIVPRRFMELVGDKDPKKVKAVIDAMLKMQKLDVATLERAYADA